MKVTLLSFFFFLSVCLNAQTKTISIGPQLDIPANFGKASKLGLGASGEGVFNFNESSAFRLYAGYSPFKGKFLDEQLSFVPVRAGCQYFIAPGEIYIYGEGGPVFYGGDNRAQTRLSLAFGAGSYSVIGKKSTFNLSLFYNYIKGQYFNYTWFSARAAYGIQWGNKNKKINP